MSSQNYRKLIDFLFHIVVVKIKNETECAVDVWISISKKISTSNFKSIMVAIQNVKQDYKDVIWINLIPFWSVGEENGQVFEIIGRVDDDAFFIGDLIQRVQHLDENSVVKSRKIIHRIDQKLCETRENTEKPSKAQ